MTSNTLDAILNSKGDKIEQAIARENIAIRQAGREVKGDQAEYNMTSGIFVVTGNLAQMYDPIRGRSSARRLTFQTTDDRLLLENR